MIYPIIIDKGNNGIINQYSFDKILNLSNIIKITLFKPDELNPPKGVLMISFEIYFKFIFDLYIFK